MMDAAKIADLRPITSGAAAPKQGHQGPNTKAHELRQACDAFEALFLQQIMKTGRATSFGDDLMSNSGVKTMQGMLDEKLTQIGSGRSGLGIGTAIYKQFASAVPGAKIE